ncbi:hypothetical protein [Ectobacillus panaciterrae]|uniref:hypothetical protein n=1 Tax=Ectobacillus panaciterrae TaxID=363872 RepID=UPI0012DEB408|nr:hypothetical protein [Ectobacillus panaciterrae]
MVFFVCIVTTQETDFPSIWNGCWEGRLPHTKTSTCKGCDVMGKTNQQGGSMNRFGGNVRAGKTASSHRMDEEFAREMEGNMNRDQLIKQSKSK